MRRVVSTYRAAYAGLPAEAWILSLVALIQRSGAMVIPFLALYLTTRLGFDTGLSGALIALSGLGAMAGSYAGGWLADRLGTMRVQVVALLLNGLGFLALGQLRSVATMAPMLVLVGVVSGAFRPANAAAFGAVCPSALRTRGMALNRLAINLGCAVGPAAGGLLAEIDYAWLFVVDASACFAATVPLLVLLRGPRVQAPAAEHTTGDHSPWRDRHLLLCLAMTMLVCLVLLQCLTTLPLYFNEVYGLSEGTIGALLAVNPLLIVVLEMVLVHRLESRPPLRVASLGALAYAVGYGLMPLGSGVPFAVLTVVVWTFGEMMESPMVAGFVINRAGPTSRGRYMSAFILAFAIAATIAPWAGMQVYDTLGPDAVWIGCCGLALCASVGYRLLARAVAEAG